MHIPDGFLSVGISVLMFIISISVLSWSWRKAKATYSKSLAPLLAISSAFVFAAQMINFPIAYGTSGHMVGGTFLALLLGPYAAVFGMTIVLLMQALFFADGGLLSFGANVFNMAIIGSFSFFILAFCSLGSSRVRFRDRVLSRFFASRRSERNSAFNAFLARSNRAR
jgi:cobalt/nickel transport system permease protein